MIMYETHEFAADWMKKFAGEDFKVFAWIRVYPNADTEIHPALRDRTDDVVKMVHGFGCKQIGIREVKGADLDRAGWALAGAQLVQDFKLIIGY